MFGNGVMIGMIVTIINHHQNAIRKVQHQATAVCCVGTVGTMLRATAVFRAVTATFQASVSTATVCVSPSQFDNDREVIHFIHSKLKKGFCCG